MLDNVRREARLLLALKETLADLVEGRYEILTVEEYLATIDKE